MSNTLNIDIFASPVPDEPAGMHCVPEPDYDYVSRRRLVEKIRTELEARHEATLCGPPGIGKTELALEYVQSSENLYDLIVWFSPEFSDDWAAPITRLARKVHAIHPEEVDVDVICEAMKRWIGSANKWLLVFDNVTDLSGARPFRPYGANGHTLFTTSTAEIVDTPGCIVVPSLTARDGATYLLRRGGVIWIDRTSRSAPAELRLGAANLSNVVACFPLALRILGDYISSRVAADETVHNVIERVLDYLQSDRSFSPRKQIATDSIGAAVRLVMETRTDEATIAYIRCCAFLAPNAVPSILYAESRLFLPPALQAGETFVHMLDEPLYRAQKSSLLCGGSGSHSWCMHPSIQDAVRDQTDVRTQSYYANIAVSTTYHATPRTRYAAWPICVSLIPQWFACAELIDRFNLETCEAAQLLCLAGVYLANVGSYAEAAAYFDRSLHAFELARDSPPSCIGVSLNNAAELRVLTGEFAKAQALAERAVAFNEETAGPYHVYTAMSVRNLAAAHFGLKEFDEAEEGFRRSLDIWQDTHGPNHPRVAGCLHSIALDLEAQGHRVEAEHAGRESLSICEAVFGSASRGCGVVLNNLAVIVGRMGRHEESQPLFARALAIMESTLGRHHPDSVAVLGNIADTFEVSGDRESAERHHERVSTLTRPREPAQPETTHEADESTKKLFGRLLLSRIGSLGTKHQDTLVLLDDLVQLTGYNSSEGDPSTAIAERAMAICEELNGPNFVGLARLCSMLAGSYNRSGMHDKAEHYLKRGLEIRRRSLGDSHPDTAMSLRRLAGHYHHYVRRYAKAERLYKQTLAIHDSLSEPDYAELSGVLDDLAHLCRRRRKYSDTLPHDALPYVERQAAVLEKWLGPTHLSTAIAWVKLASLYQKSQQYDRAVPLLEQALGTFAEYYGPDHVMTTRLKSRIKRLRKKINRTAIDSTQE